MASAFVLRLNNRVLSASLFKKFQTNKSLLQKNKIKTSMIDRFPKFHVNKSLETAAFLALIAASGVGNYNSILFC